MWLRERPVKKGQTGTISKPADFLGLPVESSNSDLSEHQVLKVSKHRILRKIFR